MKSLTDYLVLELKADTYKSAFQKAKAKGDERAGKFLDAYLKALDKETPEADELTKKITDWAKEDKQQILKLKKFCGNGDFYFFAKALAKIGFSGLNGNGCFYVAKKGNDKFFFRFNKDLNSLLSNALPDSIFSKIFTDQYAKGNEDKKFVFINVYRKQFNWYIYFLDDKKLMYIDSENHTEEKDTTELLKKVLNEIGI